MYRPHKSSQFNAEEQIATDFPTIRPGTIPTLKRETECYKAPSRHRSLFQRPHLTGAGTWPWSNTSPNCCLPRFMSWIALSSQNWDMGHFLESAMPGFFSISSTGFWGAPENSHHLGASGKITG